jgi:AraC-like DNA-binding protein
MLIFLSLTGIFLSALLIYFNARKTPSVIYLGLFFFLISLYSFIQYVVLYSKSPVLVSIFFLNIGFVTYMIGPMLYLYLRSVLIDNPRLRKSDWLHFIPAVLFFVAALPHLFTPWSEKMELAIKIVDNANYVWIFNRDFFQELLPAYIVFLSRPVLVLAYSIVSLTLYIRYLNRPDKSRTLSQQAFMTKWLAVLFAFLFILIFSHIALIVEVKKEENMLVFYTLNLLQELSGIGLVGLLISPFFFPGVLYGMPRVPEQAFSDASKLQEATSPLARSKKQPSDYEQGYMLMIQQKAENYMKEFQPYLQPDLNLASFSKLNKIPAHHLAYYFREEKKQSFTNYRNAWRIKHAKKLIEEGKTTNLTLEAIGLLSGFSSRNTFFNAFKKVEGMSPGFFTSQINK